MKIFVRFQWIEASKTGFFHIGGFKITVKQLHILNYFLHRLTTRAFFAGFQS